MVHAKAAFSAASAFTVFGAGSWGSALAMLLARNGYKTLLWGRDANMMADMVKHRQNSRFLPGIALPDNLQLSGDLKEALAFADVPLVVVPSSGFRAFLDANKTALQAKPCLVWATKGLEQDSHKLLDRVAAEVLGEQMSLAVISGPNFATEVANKVPTATTVAANTVALARFLAQALHNDWFRAYSCMDMVGVQLGGALKNAMAIASGIADGFDFGANTRAALLTRGLAEITRLSVHMGGNVETMTGLAGVGDLMLSCTDDQSRNRRFGLLLAAGRSIEEAVAEIGQVVEGVRTVKEACYLAQQEKVEMPIIEQVYQVLYEGLPPATAVERLLLRDQKAEYPR